MLVKKKIFLKFSKPLKWIESVDIHLERKKEKEGRRERRKGREWEKRRVRETGR